MGPLALVDTITAGIDLDVQRLLRMGPGKTLEFIVPDSSEVTGWRTLATLTKNFNRITGQERTVNDGSEVIFKVADPDEALDAVFQISELHVRVEDIIYSVAKTPPLASSEAHVFTLTCKIRTLRNKYFDNTK